MKQRSVLFLVVALAYASNSWAIRDLACEASDGCSSGHWINGILPVLVLIGVVVAGSMRTRVIAGMTVIPPLLMQIFFGGIWFFSIFVTFFAAIFLVDYVYKEKDRSE